MKKDKNTVINAQFVWQNDRPFASRFDDVYHATQGAFEQARYVFLQGTQSERYWIGQDEFTLLELGFGFGVNFLTTLQAYKQSPVNLRAKRLHFVSIEAYPVDQANLTQFYNHYQDNALCELNEEVTTLLRSWPLALAGTYRFEFLDGLVTLTLILGQVDRALSKLSARVDAFYLDGFSPAKNPEMWSEDVFKLLSRHAVDGARVATWSSARRVVDGLRNAGFLVEKIDGFEGKRNSLIGHYQAPTYRRQSPFVKRPLLKKSIIVVGGGIAGSSIAYEMAHRGWQVTVLSQDNPSLGHHAVAVVPVLSRDDDFRTRLSRAGFYTARQAWQGALGGAVKQMGALQFSRRQGKAQTIEAWLQDSAIPLEWARLIEQPEIADLLGYKTYRAGVYFPQSLWVNPSELGAYLLQHNNIKVLSLAAMRVQRTPSLEWQVCTADGCVQASQLVLANSSGVHDLLVASGLSIDKWAKFAALTNHEGLVTYVPEQYFKPRCMANGRVYMLPTELGLSVIGNRAISASEYMTKLEASQQESLDWLTQLIPELDVLPKGALSSWEGNRTVMSDHLPVLDEVIEGLWVATGYGSRGYTWASLLARVLATELENEPRVLESDLRKAIALR